MTGHIELEQILPPEVFERLQLEANRQKTELSKLVRDAVEEYLENLDEEFEETPDEEIEAGFLQGWHEVMTGQTRPAKEVLEELRKANSDDHTS